MTIHVPFIEPQRRKLYEGRAPGAICGVYGLEDPRDGRVRYVGASVDVWRRFKEHLSTQSAGASDAARTAWVRAVQATGEEPTVRLLQSTSIADLKRAEEHWISVYALIGEADLNCHIRRRDEIAREKVQAAREAIA